MIEADFLITKEEELEHWKKRGEVGIAQIAKKKWLTEGDNNSKFFHANIN